MNIFSLSVAKITLVLCIVIFSAEITPAQERGSEEPRRSPNATVSQTVGTTDITISYGRPAVNNRKIFGELVPYGQVWRTGANESTVLVISDDVQIEGHELEAGTYSLYTIPNKDQWTVIINSKLSWGTQYDKSQDVLRFTVEPEEARYMERLLFYFEDVTQESATIILHWDAVKVPIQITL